MEYDISSPSNDRVKRLVRLRDHKHRRAENAFMVEEGRVLDRAIDSGRAPVELYWCPDLSARPLVEGVEPVSMSPEAFSKAAYRSNPEGVLALFELLPTGLDAISLAEGQVVLVAERLEKPGNLGALLRLADAAGACGVVVVDGAVDLFNPNVVRTSTGAIFTVPMAIASGSAAAAWLRESEYRLVAAVPDAVDHFWDVDLTGRVAIWIGSESDGLSDEARTLADDHVAIPMHGISDSLNASVSAGILVYEAVRQRRKSQAE